MKNIVEFILTNGKGFFVSLEDKELSVTVTPNDGDVHFHEGSGEDCLNEYFVSGQNVQEFEVDRVNGLIGVLIRFRKGWVVKQHLLGFTKDIENANVWVGRVNKIYENKRRRLEARQEGFRSNNFRDYPVVHDILVDGHIVLRGDYPNSRMGYPVPIYKPHWQDYYVERSLLHLREETLFIGEIKTSWPNPPDHRYPHLADRVRYRPDEYSRRITQPLELIFDRGPRHDKIAVIPLAKATYFALVYVPGNAPESHCALKSEEFAGRRLEDFLANMSQPLSSGRRVVICTHSDTSVDYLLEDLEIAGRVEKGQKAAMPTIESLAFWMWKFYQDGIIACDVGIAYQLLHHWKSAGYPFELKFSFMYYDASVAVGEAYRRDDEKWGAICHRALMDCLQSQDSQIQESLNETKELIKPLGIQWIQ